MNSTRLDIKLIVKISEEPLYFLQLIRILPSSRAYIFEHQVFSYDRVFNQLHTRHNQSRTVYACFAQVECLHQFIFFRFEVEICLIEQHRGVVSSLDQVLQHCELLLRISDCGVESLAD